VIAEGSTTVGEAPAKMPFRKTEDLSGKRQDEGADFIIMRAFL